MAIPREKPINTLADVMARTDRAHFCGGVILTFSFVVVANSEN